MGVPSFNGGDALVVVVRNITTTEFEFQLDEWDYRNQVHVAETVSWMALPSGNYTLDGQHISAGSFESAGEGSTAQIFDTAFAMILAVFTQRSSRNTDATKSVRISEISANSFKVRLDE